MNNPDTEELTGTTREVRIRVTNGNDFLIADRYDGVPYKFEPKKKVTIPALAANHIFGWKTALDEDDIKKGITSVEDYMQRYTTRRFGWNTPHHMETGLGKRFFGKIKFELVTFKLIEVTEEEEISSGPATEGSAAA